ncbi:hypothetical protein GCM10028806_57020 [Spirosoma terrae]|uniref:Uncharacterized protein n=1 Tax=Spirosoma terrae TaxID=1968276 RepID=A0A6L9LBL1_9BACT|nr:hypothetical protein [Spirosoma terrae]NDU97924.1 hypothetical protein [Spirosoma terrae]
MSNPVYYKGFVIKAEATALYQWDNEQNICLETKARTAYKIIDDSSGLIYGVKHSLTSAQKTIDINGKRWKIDKSI